MKKIEDMAVKWIALFSFLLIISCSNNPSVKVKLPKSTFQETTILSFFQRMEQHYRLIWKDKYNEEFLDFCSQNNLDENDSVNVKQFLQLTILHTFFTSKSAQNTSVGDIAVIPYFWHWVNPNPRYTIIDNQTGKSLQLTPTIAMYKNYKSFADIDRTPFLFFSDLVSDSLRYYHPDCGRFATFGWCSEREMAFSCLMKWQGYASKVVAEVNHSWSVHVLSFKTKSGSYCWMQATTDNTFDQLTWEKLSSFDKAQWSLTIGSLKGSDWYNKKAADTDELTKIKQLKLGKTAYLRMEQDIRRYLGLE